MCVFCSLGIMERWASGAVDHRIKNPTCRRKGMIFSSSISVVVSYICCECAILLRESTKYFRLPPLGARM